jgi:hypothetical protein
MDDSDAHHVILRSQFATSKSRPSHSKLEREIFRESLSIATVLFVQPFCVNAIQRCEIRVEDDPHAANCIDSLLDQRDIGLRHAVRISFSCIQSCSVKAYGR